MDGSITSFRGRPALVVVDMQNCFLHSSGTFGKLGLPLQLMNDIVPTINHLRSLFLAKGLPVYIILQGYASDYSDGGIHMIAPFRELKALIRDTFDWELHNDLKPVRDGEVIVHKTRHTSFYRTELERRLKADGVGHLVVTGVGTNVCVESTVRDAVTLSIEAVTVSDATATTTKEAHEASLENLKMFGGVITSKEVETMLAKV